MSNPTRLIVAIAASLTLASVGLASPASAHRGHHHSPPPDTVLADGLLSPLRAAIAHDGTAYVSQNFLGTISKVSTDGTVSTLYTDPDGNEVGGVSLSHHKLYFTVTASDPSTFTNFDSWLKVLSPSGAVRTIADLHAFEEANNPDQTTTYGFRDIDPTCAALWPTDENGPATYTGAVDSHPYATYPGDDGSVYVADAGANDILRVSRHGHVSVVAVLPAIPYTITADAASGLGLDPCFVGATYWFEPVPTDVEMGHHGTLYATSLPGGPEGPQLGARGSVFSISMMSGRDHRGHRLSVRANHGHHGPWVRVCQVATGFVEPTGLAITPDGDMYVAQLFGDMISKVTFGRHGARVSDAISTPNPGEVEWTPRGLYYTSNVLSGTDGTSAPAGQLILHHL